MSDIVSNPLETLNIPMNKTKISKNFNRKQTQAMDLLSFLELALLEI